MALAGVVSVLLASLSVQRPLVLQPRRSLSSARRAAPCFMQDDGVTCNMRKQPKSAVALDISIPASVAQSVYDQVLGELSRNANVPGFRPGNAPTAAVINKIGNEKLKEATVEQLVDVGMKQSGKQVQLNTVGQAVLVEELADMAKSYTIGEPISFTVMIDVYPEVPHLDGKNSTVPQKRSQKHVLLTNPKSIESTHGGWGGGGGGAQNTQKHVFWGPTKHTETHFY